LDSACVVSSSLDATMVLSEREVKALARRLVSTRGWIAKVLLAAAAGCAPGQAPPHPEPDRPDAGDDIGEHCAALVGARVQPPGCEELPPSIDAGGPIVPGDAAIADPDAPDSDAPAPEAGPADAAPDGAATGTRNDCCTASAEPGCADAVVLACVCEGDGFCCTDEYDSVCVTQAASRCGIDCDARPPVSDCCTSSDVPGCSVPRVAACVCEEDPFCCAFRFDENCVNLAKARCSASCTPEEGRP
jgi:hypothetical protein